ncbi:MAG: D-isomer specific 2-hydroxyacid dehydrogenase family protein [Actinomycetota bacterium]|nr:D-isomer specific 2-hydroxyacid dehydrogenase family protein [Actinomycetota bacterium]
MTQGPRIHIAPIATDDLTAAVERGGGVAVDDPVDAEGVIWINPRDPDGLRDLLGLTGAKWIQLPFAGIEGFVAAGVIDPARTWTCTKGVYGHACAEHALALMLAAARCIPTHARERRWREGGFGSPERRLAGATVLIFGAGGIGRALITMLAPLRSRVLAVNRSGRPVPGASETGTSARLAELVPQADYVVITAASTPETHHLFDAEMIGRVKTNGWLVNVARGELIDTDALVSALVEKRIGGAALDVTDPEPLPPDHPLWTLDNVLITPHIANTWDMAVPELTALVERNVARFAAGDPLEGEVDTTAGY